MQVTSKFDRRHAGPSTSHPKDSRSEGERDCDRILYSAALRRLAGITQTVPGDLEHPVHNRLTHVLEVAQIGRRLTERLLRDPLQKNIAKELSLDPDVVEAACLAHDLGHPPFGHIAEEWLNERAESYGARDGFEGNAQSFRVVTKLAEHKLGFPGLDLTRGTLNAIIKYPWGSRGNSGREKQKWNCYSTEQADFEFARNPHELYTKRKSAEAAIMDWADDIAYSVHDMLDFYQAGKIPLDRFGPRGDGEAGRFIDGVSATWTTHQLHVGEDFEPYREAFTRVAEFITVERRFTGDRVQRMSLKSLSSFLIERYTSGVTLKNSSGNKESFLEIAPELVAEVVMLKELTWHYVIRDPALASQQEGQRVIIAGLFEDYDKACLDIKQWRLLPSRFKEIAAIDHVEVIGNKDERYRLICDLIAGMSEQQAEAMYRRLRGISTGSAFSSIIT
jgi:dGTPase